MVELSVNKLSKSFGGDTIFENISFDIKTGERVCVVGVNGCGKTTILKIIMGSVMAGEGDVFIRKNATVGYLDQMPLYDESITAGDVVDMAFTELHRRQTQLSRLVVEIELLSGEKLETKTAEYSHLEEQFKLDGGYDIRVNTNKICSGLYISEDMLAMSFSKLSGGEKTRVILAKILLEHPDILLLDEPSNHLDTGAIMWLEGFLKNYEGAVVAVSHDRYFIDSIATRVVEIEESKAAVYEGNYSYYAIEKERRFLVDMAHYNAQQRKVKTVENQIQRYRIWGTARSSEKMFRKAKELEKRLSKMDRSSRPVYKKRSIKIGKTDSNRSGNDVLAAENLSKSFEDKQLFSAVTFEVKFKQRMCIVGDNGAGKTTLLKILLGEDTPDSGTYRWGSNIKTGYLAQNIIFTQGGDTVLRYFQFRHNLTESEARNILARVLFLGDDVYKSITSLSGGERTRLKLISLIQKGVNLLILDEPTNHLDIDSRECVEEMLEEFLGTVIFVSHDRYFCHKMAGRVMEISETATLYEGDYGYYLARKQKVQQTAVVAPKKVDSKNKIIYKHNKQKTKEMRYMKRRVKELEKLVEHNEIKLLELDAEMHRQGSNTEKVQTLFEEKTKMQESVSKLMEEWEKIAHTLEVSNE